MKIGDASADRWKMIIKGCVVMLAVDFLVFLICHYYFGSFSALSSPRLAGSCFQRVCHFTLPPGSTSSPTAQSDKLLTEPYSAMKALTRGFILSLPDSRNDFVYEQIEHKC